MLVDDPSLLFDCLHETCLYVICLLDLHVLIHFLRVVVLDLVVEMA